MTYRNEGPFTVTAGEALAADRLVRTVDGTTWMYADAGEQPMGLTTVACASAAVTAVRPLNGACIEKFTASKAITAGDILYPAADGKVSDAASGSPIGRALTAALADGGKVAGLVLPPQAGGGVDGVAFDWQESVVSRVAFASAEPATPAVGARYLNTGTGTSSATSQAVTANHIYEWNGEQWTDVTPTEGAALRVEAEDLVYVYTGSAWVTFTLDDNSGGTTGGTFRLNAPAVTQVTIAEGTLGGTTGGTELTMKVLGTGYSAGAVASISNNLQVLLKEVNAAKVDIAALKTADANNDRVLAKGLERLGLAKII